MSLPFIRKTEFQDWLMCQPPQRTWNYIDNDACIVCSFLNEKHGGPYRVYGYEYTMRDAPARTRQFPGWLSRFQDVFIGNAPSMSAVFKAAYLQEQWRTL